MTTSSNASPAVMAATMRLGFKLEARGDIRRLVDVLEHRLSSAAHDLGAARSEVGALTEANRIMGLRLAELEGQLGTRLGKGERELQLERELDEVRVTNLLFNG